MKCIQFSASSRSSERKTEKFPAIDMMGGGRSTMAQSRRKVTLPPGYSQLHWMRLTQSGKDLSGLRGAPPRRKIPMDEVCRHNTEDDCWTVLDGKVYNITPYLKFHPGGVADLMMGAGGDCTALFNEYHAWVNGHGMLEKCYIGELDPDSAAKGAEAYSRNALDVAEWRAFTLVFKQTVSKDTIKMTFELPAKKTLGLEIPGQHLKVRAKINGKLIERAFTPTSKFSQTASFDLIVKVYPTGVMSSYLDSLSVGSSVEMIGPHGSIGYPKAGTVTRGGKAQQEGVKHLVLIAAGSGITPVLQLVRAAVENAADSTRVTVIYCNRSLEHIIALNTLEPLASMFPGRVKIHHVLSQASGDADRRELGSFEIGKLDQAMLAKHVPPPSPSVAVFHCGPPQFDEDVAGHLRALGFTDNQVYVF